MEHSNNTAEWLHITLRVAQGVTERALTLDVCFHNSNNKRHILQFSNRSRKAELLGLRAFDRSQKRISPERRDVILLRENKMEEHEIAPGGEWLYQLKGEIRDGFLEYQGAAYEIPQDLRITFHFEFQGVKSNSLEIDLRQGVAGTV